MRPSLSPVTTPSRDPAYQSTMNTPGPRTLRRSDLPRGHRFFVAARAATMSLCALAAATQFVGCASQAAPPDVSADLYAGPPVHLAQDPSGQIIVFESPSGGWAITLDGVYDAFQRRDAFVTVMRPNPLGMHTQAVVEQRIATFVPSTTPLRVLARVVPYSVKIDPDQPYVVVPISPVSGN